MFPTSKAAITAGARQLERARRRLLRTRTVHEARDARSDLDRHAALLEDTRQEMSALLAEQDALLDRLLELQTHPGRRNPT